MQMREYMAKLDTLDKTSEYLARQAVALSKLSGHPDDWKRADEFQKWSGDLADLANELRQNTPIA